MYRWILGDNWSDLIVQMNNLEVHFKDIVQIVPDTTGAIICVYYA